MLHSTALLPEIESYLAVRSDNTQRSYRSVITDFAGYNPGLVGVPSYWQSVKPGHAAGYIASLRWQGKADNTIRHRFNVLCAIFKWLQAMGVVQANPFEQAKASITFRSRKQVRPHKAIPRHLISQVCQTPDRSTARGSRDAAVIAVLYGCALRRSELVSLSLRDIKTFDYKMLRYFELRDTKSGKIQEQPIPDWTWRIILDWLDHRKDESHDFLFPTVTKTGKIKPQAMSTESVSRVWKKYHAIHDIDSTPHDARATACVALKEAGFEDREVARALRHSTTAMVEVYDKREKTLENNCGSEIVYE